MEYYYKRMTSPVGLLRLIAHDHGLTAVLWEHDTPGRAEGDDVAVLRNDHPVLQQAEHHCTLPPGHWRHRQVGGICRRDRKQGHLTETRTRKTKPIAVALTFSTENFQVLCDRVAARDKDLKAILYTYDYPPMWTRPNTFESLIHIILEQQVSLASALAALNKLRERLGKITPAGLLALTDEELKACYFSRQKTVYARHLAQAMESKQFSLKALEKLPDDEVREKIIALKGLGNWSADIYLMFVLRRADIFPPGDLAAVNALKTVKKLPKDVAKENLANITMRWAPYRTVATMILWHYYLAVRTKKTPATGKIEQARAL